MSDPNYASANFILRSKGVMARFTPDCPPDSSFYLNENSLEELEENSLATRLGTTIVSKVGTTAQPLGGTAGIVHSLSKLTGLSSAWRYAGKGTGLFRISGTAPGAYSQISNALSGHPWTAVPYSPQISAYPYLYIADLAGMFKDNGTLAAPQQIGIFQPQFPIEAQAQAPTEIILAPFISGGAAVVSTTTTAAVTVSGIQTVPLTSMTNIGLFQSLIVDSGGTQETVLVIGVTPTGITANFTQLHASGVAVVEMGYSSMVGAGATGTLSGTIYTSISTWPVVLDPEDYIGLYLYVDHPENIQSITLQFNTVAGAYFYRSIGQGPLQPSLSTGIDSSTAAADAIFADTLGVYNNSAGGVSGLNTIPGWTPLLLQLSDFTGTGGADFNDPVMNWQNVTGYKITIVTNATGGATVKAASLVLFGGAGPDSFAGVAYDYLFTFFNVNDYTESNPCMVMSNVDPPQSTNWVLPRRQSVLLTLTNNFVNFDPQITHVRIYRRGGTLGDNYRRIDQVPWTGGSTPNATQTYLDIWSDAQIQAADLVSFTNDVPVTSSLPVPVNTTLATGIYNSLTSFTPTPTMSSAYWTNPGNATSPTSYATDTIPQTPLYANVSSLSIPTGDTIVGISISFKGFASVTQTSLINGFVSVGGVTRRPNSFNISWPTTLQTLSFGSNSSLFGWTSSQLATGFSVIINSAVLGNTSLNSLVITVYIVNIAGQINAVEILTPVSMANISLYQQVSIGTVVAENFETVIVQAITGTTFQAYIQNAHAAGEPITATAQYGKPVNIIAVAFDQGWYAGDSNNPSTLYWSPKGNIQSVSSASYEPVSNSGDVITAVVGTAGNLYVSTLQRWFAVAPGTAVGSSPTIYPTQIDHGCVGKNAWTLRDGTVYYLALDGIRTFRGGGGEYISEVIEFLFQNTGPTPIPIADSTQFSTAVMSWWNRWVFLAYTALDGNRYRVVLDVDNKRYRTDNLYAESMFLEEDTGSLVWGDNLGLVHLDRQLTASDETNNAGTVVASPIAITLQTPYSNFGLPETEKQMQEFTLDCNTNGSPVTCELLLDDGESSIVLGTVTTTERQRVNLNIANGAGVAAYKTSLLLTGSSTQRIFLYQAKIKYLPLAMTRQSLDTFQLRFGTDESKICKQAYFEYTAQAQINGAIYYDDSPNVGFPFTLPAYSGIRNPLRVRLPAVSFRLLRCILTSTKDFQVWSESNFEVKPLCQGKGYQKFPMMP